MSFGQSPTGPANRLGSLEAELRLDSSEEAEADLRGNWFFKEPKKFRVNNFEIRFSQPDAFSLVEILPQFRRLVLRSDCGHLGLSLGPEAPAPGGWSLKMLEIALALNLLTLSTIYDGSSGFEKSSDDVIIVLKTQLILKNIFQLRRKKSVEALNCNWLTAASTNRLCVVVCACVCVHVRECACQRLRERERVKESFFTFHVLIRRERERKIGSVP